MITKGEWLVSCLGTSIVVDIGCKMKLIATMEHPELRESNRNALFITLCANQCQAVNPNNPQAVAENIGEAVEALKRAKGVLEGEGRTYEYTVRLCEKVLAKIEAKGVTKNGNKT